MTTEAIGLPVTKIDHYAKIFSALGDRTRFLLMSTLADNSPYSIAQLTTNMPITRQAVTKHLDILQKVGLVTSMRTGRVRLFELRDPIFTDIQRCLDVVAAPKDF